MKSTSETGHAKNVANFQDLVSFVTAYGSSYNPSKASLKLTALKTLASKSDNVISIVNALVPSYKNAVASRELAFEPLSKLVTRVMNALQVTDASEQVIDNAKTLARKIQGIRAKKIDENESPEIKHSSTSQMSYDSRLDNLDKLIKILHNISVYKPNEKELQVTTLNALYNTLKQQNTSVVTNTTPLSNARINRNEVLYANNTGLHDIALDVKLYVKSVFGTSSPQYKQIRGLSFKTVKI